MNTLASCFQHEEEYNPNKVSSLQSSIMENILKELQTLNRPFKYVVTCIIMQKIGAGLQTRSATFWDAAKDATVVVPFENPQLHAIVTVYGLAINIDSAGDLD